MFSSEQRNRLRPDFHHDKAETCVKEDVTAAAQGALDIQAAPA
jgi:hypothetical protein